MKYGFFWMKLCSLFLILAALLGYQRVAVARAAEVAENDSAVAEAESYNARVLRLIREAEQAAAGEEAAEPAFRYLDGAYEGTGLGFGGDITVLVTLSEDEITAIEVLSAAQEDPAYYSQAQVVVERMLREQSAEVEAVSGATFSSRGLMEAVADALGKAEA